MNVEEKEVCLNVPVIYQEKPTRNKGGDCFAYAFMAGLHHFYPENKISLDDLWECFMGKYVGGDPCLCNSWNFYKKTFIHLISQGYILEFKSDIVLPDYSDTDRWGYDYYHFNNHKEFFDRVYALISDGWLLLFSIDNDGRGPATWNAEEQKCYKNSINHLVLVDGIKAQWDDVDGMEGCRAFHYYIHVVCSTKGEYWIRLDDFIYRNGAAAWWQFIRLDL